MLLIVAQLPQAIFQLFSVEFIYSVIFNNFLIKYTFIAFAEIK